MRRRMRLAPVIVPMVLVPMVLALASTPAAAQNAGKAQTYLLEGETASRKGDHEAALKAFRKAHEASPSGATAIRIANSLYALGNKLEAYDAYGEALDKHGASLFGADKKKAKERRDELAKAIGSLELRVSEPDAEVQIDGKPAGKTPLANRRMLAGEHRVVVSKPGFSTVDQKVTVKAGSAATKIDVQLVAVTKVGTVKVTVVGAENLTITIDGKEVGPAPYTGELPPGKHEISASGGDFVAAPQTIEVEDGKEVAVELQAATKNGTLEIRTKDDQGTILVDGEEVGEGSFKGELSVGEHQIAVKRDGYETFTKTVKITASDVQVETVVLRKAASGDTLATTEEGDWTFDGLYGGINLVGNFFPISTGNSIEEGCDTLGATSCDNGFTGGGGLSGYIGYAFAPLGFELMLRGGGAVGQPSANFDGVTGSEINPLVAAPARDESFTIARVGGGGAVRLRVLVPIDRFRVTGAIGAGAAYRHLLFARNTTAAEGGGTNKYTDNAGYVTPVLSFEVAGQVRIAANTSLALGLDLWLEHAPGDTATEPDGEQLIVADGDIPRPLATPAYDLATGTQLYLGPFVGFQFGP